MNKKRKVVVCLVLTASIVGAVFYFNKEPFQIGQLKEFEISSGIGFNGVARRLKEEEFIRSETVFKIYSFLTGRSHQLKAGHYLIDINSSLEELVEILTNGPEIISVTIVPGMTLKEVDGRLAENKIIKVGDLISFDFYSIKSEYSWLVEASSLEGFLLPDTYYFFRSTKVKEVAEKILDNFADKVLPVIGSSNEIITTVTVASLLEKEVPDYKEQEIVVGILNKRLTVNMPLQIDAALMYAKCGSYKGCPSLTKSDYNMDSPYNTYRYAGLPPQPIANPSLGAIKSATNPVLSEYWYYLSDPKTGKTIFSKTFQEHNDNRVIYLSKN